MYSSASSQGRLTIDGIQIIVGNAILPGQKLTLQLLQTTTNYLGYFYSELSDGYSKIKCQLRQSIKLMYEQQILKQFNVISCGKDDIQVTIDKDRVEVVIKNCVIVNAQVSKMIGQPMPCNLYKANNYHNPNGNNVIDTAPKHYTIRQIINNTRLRNAHLKGKVTKLPDNIGKNILCFMLQDQQQKQIQCVCYDQVADELFPQLKLGSEYLFSGFVLQKNKRYNEDQLRFRKDTKVMLLNNNNSNENNTMRGINSNHANDKVSKFTKPATKNQPKPTTTATEPIQPLIISNKRMIISHLSQQQPQQNTFFTLQGKVVFLIQKPKYRKINILDNYDDIIDIMLWQQVKQPIQKEKNYQFTFMKIKFTTQVKQGNYKYIELHSTKKTTITQIKDQEQQVVSRKPMQSYPGNFNNNNKNNNNRTKHQTQKQSQQHKPRHTQTTKRMPDHVIFNKLTDLLQVQQNGHQAMQKLSNPYPYIQCTLNFRTQGFAFKKNQDQVMNFFSFYCGSCNRSITVILSENNVVSCNRCKRDDVMVKWNLRVKAYDLNFQLPCSLQNQTSERLLNMKAFDGFVLYQREYGKFQTLVHKVNFICRACKFQIKQKQGNIYFNILEVYAKDSKSQVYNALARLKDRIKQRPKKVKRGKSRPIIRKR